jgi:hypothetical protein
LQGARQFADSQKRCRWPKVAGAQIQRSTAKNAIFAPTGMPIAASHWFGPQAAPCRTIPIPMAWHEQTAFGIGRMLLIDNP